MIAPGAVLAGKYRVERVLGEGGMGVVVQATHLALEQPVAMKFLHAEALANPEVRQRFLREAQAAVRLKSEHVARVIDVGTLENGAPYMVLEYLNGRDLSQLRRDQLTIGIIVDLMLQASEALAEAHSLGIVHRDIKPANFFVVTGADGELHLKVLDFGISKVSTMDRNMTSTSAVMGTPAYMSPEQMRSSRDVDPRSDIWSLGVVMYELFEGCQPFSGDTFTAMVLKVANDPLPPMRAQLPPGLADIVYRCLEKDPTRRFSNIAQLAAALAPFARLHAQAAISVQRVSRVLGVSSQPVISYGAPGQYAGPPMAHGSPSTLSSTAGQMGRGAATVDLGKPKRGRGALIAGVAAFVGIVVAVVMGVAVSQGRRGVTPGTPILPATTPAAASTAPPSTTPATTTPATTTPATPATTAPTPTPDPTATTPTPDPTATTPTPDPTATTPIPVTTTPPATTPTPPTTTTPATTPPATTPTKPTKPGKKHTKHGADDDLLDQRT